MFNPNQGCTGKLTGYLLNVLEMPEIERGATKQEWKALLILTTAPCKGIGRDKLVTDVPAGAEVLVPGTFKLSGTFNALAVMPNECYECQIVPLGKADIGHGQTLWQYKLGVDKATVKKRADFGVAGMLAPASATKALPAAGDTVGGSGEDVPFA